MNALKIKKGSSKKSAYDLRDPNSDIVETHTLAVIVDNEPGVLARVIGLFSGRGYNIDSLTVAEVDHTGHQSRITIVTGGTPAVIEQIKAQLGRLVPVSKVVDLTEEGAYVERELALVKLRGKGEPQGVPRREVVRCSGVRGIIWNGGRQERAAGAAAGGGRGFPGRANCADTTPRSLRR